jgi:RNA polymerase sigma-70 factor (sigma-E family)
MTITGASPEDQWATWRRGGQRSELDEPPGSSPPGATSTSLGRQDFVSFVHAQLPGLVRFGVALTGNPHDGHDLVQTALEKAGLHWNRISDSDNPIGYVKKIMVNARVSGWRRRRRETLVDDIPDGQGTLDRHPSDHAAVWHMVAALPKSQRAIVALRFLDGHTEAETAAILGITVGTVKSQTSRAMQRLRERVAAANEEDM